MKINNDKTRTLNWVNLSLNDLRVSRLLYTSNEHRSSYWHFQQATEKACKAFAILGGATDDEVKNSIGHNPFSSQRRVLVDQKKTIATVIDQLNVFPQIRDHSYSQQLNFRGYFNSLDKGIRALDKLHNTDLINLSLNDIRYLLDELEEIEYECETMPRLSHSIVIKNLKDYTDWIGHFETPAAIETHKEYLGLLENQEETKKFHSAINALFRFICVIGFTYSTFMVCMIFTVQHSQLTRYLIDGKNPLDIYNKKLPLVKEQPDIMNVFERALKKFKRLVNRDLKI